MKRFHVHVGVENLDASIAFYSGLFGEAPSVTKSDYAKWMLDDPRVTAVGLSIEGIDVMHGTDPRDIPKAFREAPTADVLVVRTPAVPTGNPLLAYWESRGAVIKKRSEVLGLVTRDRRTSAVAGTRVVAARMTPE